MEEEETSVRWTAELEVALFHSMHGHKPVGLNKHFHMACIQHRLHQSAGTFLTTEQIWAHLRSLYDLQSLDEFEKPPFSVDETREFFLPESYFMTESSKAPSSSAATSEGEGEGSRRLPGHSTSPSPVSSPLSKPSTKRKRT